MICASCARYTARIRRMAARVSIPVIADGDTGHGDLHNVQRTIEAFESAGAAGILLDLFLGRDNPHAAIFAFER